ncbi:MAG: 6-phosphogluconolactonase [Rudaea sp.]|uniref:6-phosphogluconolactonase n=1 Tax=unclassified Rudaea TaxID=2627037 RepID=UPI0010F5EAF0|nr:MULTISPECIES: 6-phosphogluconolactonase [unclassified Rudaea]MBN8888056.1 6-phosphogluconolactonase [Rudaea sp.]MBR0344128.1 6-phosphogluconolactonase [Rudaea sp.]
MSALDYHRYADGAQLAIALAAAVANDLARGIETRGHALLALSGGKTPLRFFQALALQKLDWANVTVTLVDERWVAPDDARSNEGFVRANLLRGAAAAARFVPLYKTGAATPEEGLHTIAASIAMLDLPFDALVLGMGEDGHTASFFPDSDGLANATDPKTDAIVLPIHARSAGEPRITLTLPTILDSRAIYLHIEGERKRSVLETARYVAATNRAYPISAVLRNARAPLQVFWCP